MTKILGFLFGDALFAWGQKALYTTIIWLVYGMIIASYAFVIDALIVTYNLITQMMVFISNYSSTASSNDSLGVFFQLLSCVGFIDAFNATKIMFFSSVSFLLLRYLYLQTVSIILILHRFMTPLLTK